MTHQSPVNPTRGSGQEDTEFRLPEDHWPLPELSHTHAERREPTTSEFLEVAETEDFANLRSTFRSFAFPMTIAGLVAYFVFVVLSIFVPEFMGRPVFGSITVGILLGLLQFAITWIWTAVYVNFATKRMDPLSTKLKSKLEGI
ncbi:MAG TPA: DUF485 domain-containing protein [Arachnia sp.]|nr:DUF485 domain-containing protein [Arachnia sp.]HMT86249.1 DUF485 domain-containing protein [Arachnia sp.]